MKRISLAFLALAAALAITPLALADTVNGTIGVSGGNDTWTSSSVTFQTPNLITVADTTGDFASIPLGTIVTVPSSFFFSSPGELTFNVGSGLATFTASSLTVSLDNDQYLDISGTGVLSLPGFAPTPATFSFDSTDSNLTFGSTGSSTFGIDATAATPEPSSLLLLGTALFGLAFVVFKKAKASGLILPS